MRVRRSGIVENHGRRAGVLEELEDGSYRFTYDPEYLLDTGTHGVSVSLPKRREPFTAPALFPFFAGLLAEGSTRELQSRVLKIDEADDFGLLLATAADTIGSVTVRRGGE